MFIYYWATFLLMEDRNYINVNARAFTDYWELAYVGHRRQDTLPSLASSL